MKISKYILAGGIVFGLSSLFFAHASERPQERDFEQYAREYIENSADTEYWKGKNPRLSGESLPLFVGKSENPSYLEYQVSCDDTLECGFLLVNTDGNDVMIPISGTAGVGPARALTKKGEEEHTKVYYFGPFEQYAINEQTGKIYVIDPTYYIRGNPDDGDMQEKVKAKFEAGLIEVEKYKLSDDFKHQIKNLQSPKNKNIDKSGNGNDSDPPPPSPTGYSPPVYASDTFLSSGNKNDDSAADGCHGRVPCYDQHVNDYRESNGTLVTNCLSGCVPVAVGIIYGYHAKYRGASYLFVQPGSSYVPLENAPQVEHTIDVLRSIMHTDCGVASEPNTPKAGSTAPGHISSSILFAHAMGYMDSDVYYSGMDRSIPVIFTAVKKEVDKNRPILLFNSSHAMVGYGYSSNVNNDPIVTVNLGAGPYEKFTVNGQPYFYSKVDYNLNSLYYNNAHQGPMKGWVTFKIY